jgi:hypothetical protein
MAGWHRGGGGGGQCPKSNCATFHSAVSHERRRCPSEDIKHLLVASHTQIINDRPEKNGASCAVRSEILDES